jgi:RNA polymerase sigma-70 factor (ECF subfamily)
MEMPRQANDRASHEEFTDFVREYREDAFRYAVFFSGSTTYADEIVAESFITLWSKWPERKSSRNLKSWLVAIIKNQTLNTMTSERARKSREMREGIAILDQHGRQELANDRILILHECISTLDEEEIQLLVLCYVDGLNYEQIGAALNLTPGAVSMKLTRLRRHLKEKIEYLESVASNG